MPQLLISCQNLGPPQDTAQAQSEASKAGLICGGTGSTVTGTVYLLAGLTEPCKCLVSRLRQCSLDRVMDHFVQPAGSRAAF